MTSTKTDELMVALHGEQGVAMCLEGAYVTARSACMQFGMKELEGNVTAGVETGAASLGPTEKALMASDLLRRLFGKTYDELIEEQRRDIELEDARLAQMFNHD